jgi:hypothetical protein
VWGSGAHLFPESKIVAVTDEKLLAAKPKSVKVSLFTDGDEIMRAYVDIVGAIYAPFRHELQSWELQLIGEFTRENVLRHVEHYLGESLIGLTPVQDFHAVCGRHRYSVGDE